MFRGPSLIVSTMQEETTPIFKRLWYDWTQQQPGIKPTNPLGQCWVPPVFAFYDQHGLLRTYSLPGGSIRSPHPGSPRGWRRGNDLPYNPLLLPPVPPPYVVNGTVEMTQAAWSGSWYVFMNGSRGTMPEPPCWEWIGWAWSPGDGVDVEVWSRYTRPSWRGLW